MLAGGAEAAVIPSGIGGFIACKALSKRNGEPHAASRPWDKGRDGFVMGEGAGIFTQSACCEFGVLCEVPLWTRSRQRQITQVASVEARAMGVHKGRDADSQHAHLKRKTCCDWLAFVWRRCVEHFPRADYLLDGQQGRRRTPQRLCSTKSVPLVKALTGAPDPATGVVVLEELEHARARGAPILAEFIGGSFTSDAYHLTDPRPDGLGVTRCIQNVRSFPAVD